MSTSPVCFSFFLPSPQVYLNVSLRSSKLRAIQDSFTLHSAVSSPNPPSFPAFVLRRKLPKAYPQLPPGRHRKQTLTLDLVAPFYCFTSVVELPSLVISRCRPKAAQTVLCSRRSWRD